MKQKLIALLVIMSVYLTGCQKPYEFKTEGKPLEMTPTTMLSQKEKTEALVEELNGGTLEEPVIIVDPYDIAPLSAVMEFETVDEVEVEMVVKGKSANANLTYHFGAATKHVLPIIGLLHDQIGRASCRERV